jgi:hypothetical protein
MSFGRRRFELICFGLYLVAVFVSTSMEAVGHILTR